MTDGLLVNLEVQPSVILVGGQNKTATGSQSAGKKQEGFAITAKGAFTISSRVKSSGSGYSLAYDAFRLDSFPSKVSSKPLRLPVSWDFTTVIRTLEMACWVTWK
ncbi:MAG: hypothetical protein H6561_19330 [Lewinellaceae bacterium]|nr:hypothetical protein [Lewinellaceae bacterium]